MMSDLIDRQAAIDALRNVCDRCTIGDKLYDAIIALPSAQPEKRWISSGKKPPEEGSYLVWMPFAPPECRITVAKYCGGYWNIKTPISAWMPLPEPWKGE